MPYNNYPKAASENAQRALDHKEKNGSSCGTPVGWARANQLANRERISDDVLVRTYSFLSRARVYDQGKFTDEDGKEICGSIMYAAWGGDEMLRWAKSTLEQMETNERHIKSVVETDEEIVITFGKGEMSDESGYKEEERAEAVRQRELRRQAFDKLTAEERNALGLNSEFNW